MPRDANKIKAEKELLDEIYRLKVQRRLPWRAIAQEVGLGHEACRRRYLKSYPRITDEEREAQREIENDKLDDSEARWFEMYARARQSDDDQTAAKALDGMTRVHRSRVELNGLAVPVRREIVVTREDLENELDAFLMGLDEADRQRIESDV